jgi:hypothetical protein
MLLDSAICMQYASGVLFQTTTLSVFKTKFSNMIKFLSFFSYALNNSLPTMEILIPDLATDQIGKVTKMNPMDIFSLNKAYSCEGTVLTYGGGSQQVHIY